MKHPKELSITDFTYNLPQERIARYPLKERDQSRLLIFKDREITESRYSDLHEWLPEGATLVFNNTRVVQARIIFEKPTGGKVEIFCLQPGGIYPDITTAMASRGRVEWQCLVGGASKWKQGTELIKFLTDKNGRQITLTAVMLTRLPDAFTIEMKWDDERLSFSEILQIAGEIPLPPYLQRRAEKEDLERYQTVYAEPEGSVAAPTAGLHFTPSLLQKLQEKKIDSLFLTLHVGAGTFKPVKAEKMEEHEMHAEYMVIPQQRLEELLQRLPNRIISVGTTSLRTIESLYWMGVKTIIDPGVKADQLEVQQWYPYDAERQDIPAGEALSSLLNWMKTNKFQELTIRTSILIAPGYRLRIADGIITNFHQPQSTLLLLIAAIVGDDWKKIYNYAMKNGFRFLSYGDGCFLM
ncbi:MAG TPA: S-adenosylmethionine:tRNA ribosyltransferase-isomerase [Parasegetibacter sp.]|jgi:S-adenosylmethionine:tRNA ribosyltransferase-isomerase